MIKDRAQMKNNSGEPDGDKSVQKIFVQIYEIQTPREAEAMIELGVDRMGSVILSQADWKVFEIREAMAASKNTPVKTSLIPLFSHPDVIYRVVDFYRPDIIHFCESLVSGKGDMAGAIGNLINLQEGFRKRFPEVQIMRSIPVGQEGRAQQVPSLETVRHFEAVSDYFLLDTLLSGDKESEQPEAGFVGITGKTCDWDMAAKVVETSRIPVILAGGISPENVSDAVSRVKPAGVDSCTNTNATDPGGNPIRFKKDPEKVRRLIEAARKAEKEIK